MRSKEYFINIDQYRSRLLADIIDYVALGPQDYISNCVLLDSRAECMLDFFDKNIVLCEISTDLMDRVSSFPLVQLFEMLKGREKDEGYLHIMTFIYIYLFPFVSRIPLYYAQSELTSFLCLVSHSGKDQFIPGISIDSRGIATTLDIGYHPAYNLTFHNSDVFLLYILGPEITHTNPERITTFLEQLQQVYWTHRGPFLIESHLLGKLIFEKEIWRLDVSDYDSNHRETRAAVTTFLLLGYIIFFLPLCGQSPALVQYCQQRTFLTQPVISFFPNRTTLLLQAMESYLQRFERDYH